MPKPLLRSLLALGSAALAALALAPFWPALRGPQVVEVRRLSEADAAKLSAPVAREEFDPHCYFRYRAGLEQTFPWKEHPRGRWRLRTNSLGLREDGELLDGPVDLRVLVTGDSHTDGVCDNAESFTNLLEARLAADFPGRRVEAINAGKGRYTFHHYLGVLERFLPLRPDAFVVVVYGGNDFEEGLGFEHRRRGTKRLPPAKDYGPLIERALQVDQPSLAQAFVALKYFAARPTEREPALAMACEFTDAIVARCRENSVRPIFAYLPPPTDVQWSWYRERFEAMQATLELTEADLELVDGLADRWLDHVRERGVEAIDLRPLFQSQERTLYWNEDYHINLEAHRLIARELEGRFVERPADDLDLFVVESTPDDGSSAAREAWSPALSGAPLRRRELSRAEIERIFAPGPSDVIDPGAYVLHGPRVSLFHASSEHPCGGWTLRTNARGLRADEEPASAPPDLRVLLLGDGQLEGACENAETAAHLLEEALRARHPGRSIEVLNGAKEGYGFHNYLGAFEHFRDLRPDALVVLAYGGNDFLQAVKLQRVFGSDEPPEERDRESDRGLDPPFVPDASAAEREFFASCLHFARHPRAGAQSVVAALELTAELQRACAENEVELMLAYLPPAIDVHWDHLQKTLDPARAELGLQPGEMEIVRSLARSFLSGARKLGLDVLDLEPALRSGRGPYYWREDHRLDPAGHALLARQLLPWVERRFDLGAR